MPKLVSFPGEVPTPESPLNGSARVRFPAGLPALPVDGRAAANAPLWLGPSDSGWCGGVTQSMLQNYLCCRERFRIKYVLGLRPQDRWEKSSGYGNAWHACEEALARYGNGADWQGALTTYTTRQMAKYKMQRQEIAHWDSVCRVQFPEYVKYWSQHPDVLDRQPLMQEQVFDAPYQLPSGRSVRLRGKYDSVDSIPSQGGVYLAENKTKSDIDAVTLQRQLKFDFQTMMYLIALKRSLNDVCGVRYNVVLREVTIRPHAAKTKKGRTYKTKPSTPDTYTPAETDVEFYERLRSDYYAAKPEKYFFRLMCRVSDKDIAAFERQCLQPVLENLCDDHQWWEWCLRKSHDHWDYVTRSRMFPAHSQRHFRFPFGVYNVLVEGGFSDYDEYLEYGSEAGLHRAETLFSELRDELDVLPPRPTAASAVYVPSEADIPF